MQLEDFLRRSVNRRTALKASTAAFLTSQMALFEGLAQAPQRPVWSHTRAFQWKVESSASPARVIAATAPGGTGPLESVGTPVKLPAPANRNSTWSRRESRALGSVTRLSRKTTAL